MTTPKHAVIILGNPGGDEEICGPGGIRVGGVRSRRDGGGAAQPIEEQLDAEVFHHEGLGGRQADGGGAARGGHGGVEAPLLRSGEKMRKATKAPAVAKF